MIQFLDINIYFKDNRSINYLANYHINKSEYLKALNYALTSLNNGNDVALFYVGWCYYMLS